MTTTYKEELIRLRKKVKALEEEAKEFREWKNSFNEEHTAFKQQYESDRSQLQVSHGTYHAYGQGMPKIVKGSIDVNSIVSQNRNAFDIYKE